MQRRLQNYGNVFDCYGTGTSVGGAGMDAGLRGKVSDVEMGAGMGGAVPGFGDRTEVTLWS